MNAYCSRIYINSAHDGKARKAIWDLDEGFIGTADYMGFAYFWAYKYRHVMRDATSRNCKVVHDLFMISGLDASGETTKHDEIVNSVFDGAGYC